MRIPAVTLMCSAIFTVACASALAGTVYKWVDEKGVVHYSDQPHENAQSVDLKSAQTYQSTGVTAPSSSSAPPADANGGAYRACTVTRPEHDEVFFNTDTVTAKVRVDPGLRQGDRVAFSVDGKRTESEDTSVTMKVDRGSHSITAQVLDAAGNAICSSPSVTFHVRQPSRQAPNSANRPHF